MMERGDQSEWVAALRRVRELVQRMECEVQAINIQRVQACSEAKWAEVLKERGHKAWFRFNAISQIIDGELKLLLGE